MLAVTLAFLLFSTTACDDDKVNRRAREVGEEGSEFVEEVGPESEESGTPAVPTATITIGETMNAVETSNGLLALSPAAATGVIDRWIQTLRGNPLVDDNDILVDNLLKLKSLLSRPTIDGEAVGEILENLAEETEEAAEDNDDELVEKLADILHDAADALD